MHERFAKAFRAGVWMKQDKGPWLGRALIYKLQGKLHADENDIGPTVTFPCGNYLGGEMLVPQFGGKFR
jgi:hypothetical protein